MAVGKSGEIQFACNTEIQQGYHPMTDGRFDPAKDAANHAKAQCAACLWRPDF
jgi:hypothetical protein